MDSICDILISLHPEVDFKNTNGLIDNGILDSFDIVTLVGELNDLFNINISVELLVPENFNSLNAIENLVISLLKS